MRRLLFAIPIVLVCAALTVVFGPAVLPQATTNRIAAALIEQVLDHPVAVSGQSELTLFPTFRLMAHNVSAKVAARGGKDTPALFDIGILTVEADSTALLYNRVRIDRVKIESPVLRFHVDADGTANWRRNDVAKEPQTAPNLDRDWGWWDQFDVGQVELLDGRLLWVDRVRGWRLEANKIGLQSSKPLNTTSGPGFALAGNATVNGEPLTLRLETGAISKALAGVRFPLVAEITGAPISFRYQGAAAKRQVFFSDGSIKLEIPDLKQFQRWLGGGDAIRAAGGRLDLAARLEVGGDGVTLRSISLDWPGGKGTGAADTQLRRDGTLALDGDFHLDTLDIGAFGGEAVLAAVTAFLPERLVGKVNLDWRGFRRFTLKGGPGRGVLTFSAGPERWSVAAESDQFYGGRASAKIRWGTAEGMASLRTEISLSRIEAGPLLKDLANQEALSGRADVRFDLFSVDGNPRQLTAALAGEGRFNVINGTLTDPGLIRQLGSSDKPVKFAQMLGSFKVGQGIVRTNDLLLRSADISLLGTGALDLVKGYVDIDMRSVSRKGKGPGAKPEIKPFRIEGPISAFGTARK